MLGSCSKDDTEIAPVNGDNEVIFTAGMTIGDETRTGIAVDPNDPQHTVYTWDFGDMVGVSVASGKIVPFINLAASGSATANFGYAEEDAAYVGEGNAAYFVYPYNEDNVVTMSGRNAQVTLSVPATQRYRNDSFAPMTAPAVAYTDSFKKGDGYTFKAVTSFIRVPLIGNGTLKGLKMKIDNGADALKIAGSNTVTINSATPELKAATDGWSDEISIDFGNGGLKLSYTDKQYVVFVVPAGLEIKANTKFTLTATLEGADVSESVQTYSLAATWPQKTLPVNIMLTIGGGNGILFGTENMVMINNTEDFLKYAFAANYDAKIGLSADPINDSVVAEYYKDGKFKTAVLLADLNYRNYAAQDQYQNALKSDEQDEILLEALKSYMQNGGIEAFSKAASIDGKGHKISYLPVYGNGIFEAAPSLLKDLTIQQATVNVPDGTKTTASFLGRLTSFRNVSGVTISGGSLLNVAEGVTPTMVGATANASTLPLKAQMTISRYPSVNGVAADFAYYATTLNINADVVANNPDKAVFINSATPRFAKFKGSKDGVIISKVSNATIAKVILDAVDTTGKSFSVMDRANVSYWTGTVPASVTDDKIVTAEDLAYYVRKGGSVTLTHNIDLQGKDWMVGNGTLTVDGGKKKISNAVVVADETASSFYTYSLLGNVVNVSNLTVDGVKIDVEAGSKPCVIGGVAYQGSATNVTVSNVTINVASDVQFYQNKYNHVGGLISHATADSNGNTVSSVAIECNGNKNAGPVGAMFGEVSGSFNKNALSESAIAMVGSWTIAVEGSVEGCNSNSAIVENVFFAPVSSGVMSLTFDGCSTPCCNNLVNTTSNDIVVDITVGGETKTERLHPGVNEFNK